MNPKTIGLAALLALASAQDVRAQEARQAGEEAGREAGEKVDEAKGEAAEETAEARKKAAEESREAQQDVAETREEGSREVREAQREAAEEQREATGEKREAAEEQRAAAPGTQRRSMFEGQKNFDLDGKVQSVSDRSITIAREDLPPVTLEIERYTAIELDGEKAAHSQLRQGQDVEASFNLEGDKPVAVELKAETKK